MKARFSASLLALLILASAARSAIITKELSFEGPVLAVSGGEAFLSVKGCRTIARPGAPMVPVYPAVFVIPPGEEIASVTVTPLSTQTMAMPAPAAAMPDQTAPGRAWSGVKGRDPAIYGSSAWYPATAGEISTVQRSAGVRLAYVSVYPLRPSGSDGRALFASRVQVVIETRPGLSSDSRVHADRSARAASLLEGTVENPAGLAPYHEADGDAPGGYLSASPVPYVIITSEELSGAFAQLAEFREHHGLRVETVTTEWIDANHTGADLQEKIREFIRYAWEEWHTEYVLLGGDVSVIPHRGMYVKAGEEVETDIPTDMYYSCLDGNWNSDGDAYFGEPGEEDLIPEVSIGRLPVETAAEIDAFTAKLILYTDTPPSSAVRTALMAGELLWSIDGIDTWGGDCMDEALNGSDDFGFSSAGISPDFSVTTLYDRDLGTWSLGDLAPALNGGVNLVNHLGHSNQHMVARLSIYEMGALENVSSAGMPFVLYSQGCYPGSFDNRDDLGTYHAADCVGEQLVTSAEGAVAFVGNTRLGWSAPGSTCGVSQFFDRQFIDALFGEGITEIGRALDDSRVDNIPFLSYAAVRYVMYEMCLLGDPAMSVWTGEPSALTVTHGGALESGENSIYVVVAGDGGPLAGARVSVMSRNPEIYHTELTGTDGAVRLFVETSGAEELELSVSAPGHYSYNALLPVYEPVGEGIEIGWIAVDDSGIYGSGDGDGLIESGETVKIDLVILNHGGETARNTVLRFVTTDEYLAPVIDLASVGAMPPRTTAILPAVFTVDVIEDAPDGHLARFDIEIESDLALDVSRHTVAVNAPGLVLDSFFLSDIPEGNGNGCIEAWEHLVVKASWMNSGSVDIVSPTVTISCPYGGWCKVVKASVTLDDIPVGTSAELPPELMVYVRENAPPFSPVEVRIKFEADNIPARFDTLSLMTCGYALGGTDEEEPSFTHGAVTGYDGWRLSEDDYLSAPDSWKCGGKNGDVYPNMAESYLVTPPLCLGENSSLTFWHRMEAEAGASYPYWARDGAIVEISTDLGLTWQTLTPAGNYPCRAASTNTIFLAPYQRCFSGSISWKFEEIDLSLWHGPAMIRFHFASDEQYGFEGWYIDDISLTTDRVTGTEDPPSGTPKATSLGRAWPNPFNPTTRIPFDIPAAAEVEIRIFDISGRLVRSLCRKRFEAGAHSVLWDGKDDGGSHAASGVYFCRMRTDVYTAASRLVLLR